MRSLTRLTLACSLIVGLPLAQRALDEALHVLAQDAPLATAPLDLGQVDAQLARR